MFLPAHLIDVLWEKIPFFWPGTCCSLACCPIDCKEIAHVWLLSVLPVSVVRVFDTAFVVLLSLCSRGVCLILGIRLRALGIALDGCPMVKVFLLFIYSYYSHCSLNVFNNNNLWSILIKNKTVLFMADSLM